MANSFWPEKAWLSLIKPVGNWTEARAGEDAKRVRRSLDDLWTGRLRQVRPDWLSSGALDRILSLRDGIHSKSPVGAGFEIIEGALEDPNDLWFFELGANSWMAHLARLRRQGRLPQTQGAKAALKIEQIWARNGAEETAKQLDKVTLNNPVTDTTVALYRLPLAIWHDRNIDLAIKILDHLSNRLESEVIASFGATWPLTFGLVHALRGDLVMAEHMLDQDRLAGRPRGWSGVDGVEARYQRARYLWAQEIEENNKLALDLLEEVISAVPSFILRVLSDDGWNHVNMFAQSSLQSLLAKIYTESSGAWTRWQQGQNQGVADERIKMAQDMVRHIGPEGYILVAAAATLPESGHRRTVNFDQAFLASCDRLRNFLKSMPDDLELSIGDDLAGRPIVGGADSELARLEEALEKQDAEAVEAVERLMRELPGALKMGLVQYGLNLSQALTTAGEVVENELNDTPNAAGRQRLKEIVALLNDCVAQVEPIKKVGQGSHSATLSVGTELAKQVMPIWKAFMDIQSTWGRQNAKAFGQMNILPDIIGDSVQLNAGGFIGIRAMVVDGSNVAVPGIPVSWKIVSGRAVARGSSTHLTSRLDVSMRSGRAILTLEAPEEQSAGGGKIELRILGQRNSILVPYIIK